MIRPIIVVAPGASTDVASTVARSAAWSLASFAFVPILVLFIGGMATFMVRSHRASAISAGVGAGLTGGGWAGGTPLQCGGNDSIDASDVTVAFSSGSAIDAGGNCHVTCTRCTIKAPVAISAGGNAEITLIDSHVEGSQTGVEAGGNAQVKFAGNSTLVGSVSKGGNAQVMAPPGSTPVATPTPTTLPVVVHPPSAPLPPHPSVVLQPPMHGPVPPGIHGAPPRRP